MSVRPAHEAPPASHIGIRFGVIGGVLASLLIVGPQLLGWGGRFTDFAGMMVALVAVYLASRAIVNAHPQLDYRRRVLAGTLSVAIATSLVGVALWSLYRFLRPDLLAARYAAYEAQVRASGGPAERVGVELERLAAQKAQYLDPAYQAIGTAGTLFFFGMLLALYAAWRWQVAQRLAARAAARRDSPPPR